MPDSRTPAARPAHIWLSYANQTQIHGWAEQDADRLTVGQLVALSERPLPSLSLDVLRQCAIVQIASLEHDQPEAPVRWTANRLSGHPGFHLKYATPLPAQAVLSLNETQYPQPWRLFEQVTVDLSRLRGITLLQAETETLLRDALSTLFHALSPAAGVLLIDPIRLEQSLAASQPPLHWQHLGQDAGLSIERLSVPVFLRLVSQGLPPTFQEQALVQLASCVPVDRPLVGLSSLAKPVMPMHPLLKRQLATLHQDHIFAEETRQALQLADWRQGTVKRLGLTTQGWPSRYQPWLIEALEAELSQGLPGTSQTVLILVLDDPHVPAGWLAACQQWAHQHGNLAIVVATVGLHEDPWQSWAQSCIKKETTGTLSVEGRLSALASIRLDPQVPVGEMPSSFSPIPTGTDAMAEAPPAEPLFDEQARATFPDFIRRELGSYRRNPLFERSSAVSAYSLDPALAPAAPPVLSSYQIPLEEEHSSEPPSDLSSYQVSLLESPADPPALEEEGPEPVVLPSLDTALEGEAPVSASEPSAFSPDLVEVTTPPAISEPPVAETFPSLEATFPESVPQPPIIEPPVVLREDAHDDHPCLSDELNQQIRMAMNEPPPEPPASTTLNVTPPEAVPAFETVDIAPQPTVPRFESEASSTPLDHLVTHTVSLDDWMADDADEGFSPILTSLSDKITEMDQATAQLHTPVAPDTPAPAPTAPMVSLDAMEDWTLPPASEIETLTIAGHEAMAAPETGADWLQFDFDWDGLTGNSLETPAFNDPLMSPPTVAQGVSDPTFSSLGPQGPSTPVTLPDPALAPPPVVDTFDHWPAPGFETDDLLPKTQPVPVEGWYSTEPIIEVAPAQPTPAPQAEPWPPADAGDSSFSAPEPAPIAQPEASPPPASVSQPPASAADQWLDQRVQHPTYGLGTVKKVLDMDGRLILTVQFDSTGKRLLDPSLSPLELLPGAL